MRIFWVYGPLLAAALIWNVREGTAGALWLGAPLAGLAAWTLIEYLIHRFVFHRLAPHWQHHQHPADPQYLFAPLWLSLTFAAVVWGLFSLAAGSWRVGALVETGTIAGYLAYELVHLVIHSPRKGSALLVALRKHHFYHHFADDTRCYGVVTPFWDRVFRSLPKPDFPYHEADTGSHGAAHFDLRPAGTRPERRSRGALPRV